MIIFAFCDFIPLFCDMFFEEFFRLGVKFVGQRLGISDTKTVNVRKSVIPSWPRDIRKGDHAFQGRPQSWPRFREIDAFRFQRHLQKLQNHYCWQPPKLQLQWNAVNLKVKVRAVNWLQITEFSFYCIFCHFITFWGKVKEFRGENLKEFFLKNTPKLFFYLFMGKFSEKSYKYPSLRF